MSGARRFLGTGVAALGLLVVAAVWWATGPQPAEPATEAAIFRFEKEQVVGFTVVRPDETLAFRRVDGRWVTEGASWRPSASMVRRVAHQLHDLSARATVTEATDDLERYGLGPDAIRVELALDDGRTLAFAVGDPNPTSVSWYLRTLPDGPVTVVKKAAVDYFRLDAEAFREDRIALFDAGDCERVDATVDGRRLAFRRVDAAGWAMTEPEDWSADRDRVRRILGSVAALRAERFVADRPADLQPWGLGEQADRVTLTLSSGEPITLRFGRRVPDTEPARVFAWRAEDDAVYEVRESVLQPLREPLSAYRNAWVVSAHASEVTGVRATVADQTIRVHRSADTWRWEADGGEVAGATPRRLVEAATNLRALDIYDAVPAGASLDAPEATLVLELGDGEPLTLVLGTLFEAPGESRPVLRQYVRRGEGGPVYVVPDALSERIRDLFREHGRRLERSEDRHR